MDRSPLEALVNFLDCSPTAFHAVHNAAAMLSAHGFTALSEDEEWHPERGKAYYVKRNDSALIAFRIGSETPESAFRIVASHTDSPALKLKENPALSDGTFTRLNVEPYGGGIFYSFLDRPLTIAGRIVREKESRLVSELFESRQNVVIPSLAIHMDRTVNEKFAPNPQTDLLPLYALEKEELGLDGELDGAIAFDLFAACKEPPFFSGKHGEFLSAPRIDNLSSVAASLWVLGERKSDDGIGVAACFDSEEVGSRTLQGAGSGFLKSVLNRIADGLGLSEEQRERMLARSFMISLDNAHLPKGRRQVPDLFQPLGYAQRQHAGGDQPLLRPHPHGGLRPCPACDALRRGDLRPCRLYGAFEGAFRLLRGPFLRPSGAFRAVKRSKCAKKTEPPGSVF